MPRNRTIGIAPSFPETVSLSQTTTHVLRYCRHPSISNIGIYNLYRHVLLSSCFSHLIARVECFLCNYSTR